MEERVLDNAYGAVTPAIVRELREILGEKAVISDDAEKLQPYGFDVKRDEPPRRSSSQRPESRYARS